MGSPTEPSVWESDVVLADGGTVHLRPLRRGEEQALRAFYSRLSDESRYFRFHSSASPDRALQYERVDEPDDGHRFVLLAQLGDDVVAVARFDQQGPDSAEVAFAVQDDQQGRGLGTVMLEHLAAVARTWGIRRFVAVTLGSNRQMLRVFERAGFALERSWDHGVATLSFDIAPTAAYTDVQLEREHLSEARSIARLLAPSSVAVIGAGRDRTSIGRVILENLVQGEFAGAIHPVNPNASSVAGLRAYDSVVDVPGAVDLAVVALPAEQVLDVAQECAEKGVHGIIVVSAGFGEVSVGRERERELVALARRNGMRVVGPNGMGVLNTHPDVRLNATFAPRSPPPGRVGFASQSGGLGIGLLTRARELGFGVSTFVSMGNKADVSSNDLLQYWEDDPETDVILLYLESFGNPRKFARLARRVARRTPIVAVKSGRTTAGARGTSSHTAALASSDVAVDALFREAGVMRVDTLEELFDTARVLAHQPIPDGHRVGIVSNGGGPAILAADACVAAGLEVNELKPETQATIRSFVSSDAAVANPVDLVASATPEAFSRSVHALLTAPEIDAIIAIFVAPVVTSTEQVAASIEDAVARSGVAKPVLTCFFAPDGTVSQDHATIVLPTFAFPEAAARALARVADHAEWRRRPSGRLPDLDRIDIASARELVLEHITPHPEGVWLDAPSADALLTCFGVSTAVPHVAATADHAAERASEIGFPVALKAASGELVHKSDVGGVRTGLATHAEVRQAFVEIHAALGDRMGGAIVQPMVGPGVETIVGVTADPSVGPLVLFGMGGVHAELLRDTAVRLAPLSDVDAHALVRDLRTSPLLLGYRDAAPVDTDALEDLLLRVGVLAQHLPEVVELDCNPVMATSHAATVVDTKVRLAVAEPKAPAELRRLRPIPAEESPSRDR